MPSTTIYTLSLHDALPICPLENGPVQLQLNPPPGREFRPQDIALSPDGKHLAFVTGGSVSKLWVRALDSLTARELRDTDGAALDRKSTRLNSSHGYTSYAVHHDLHSFPTRRSSDLSPRERASSAAVEPSSGKRISAARHRAVA